MDMDTAATIQNAVEQICAKLEDLTVAVKALHETQASLAESLHSIARQMPYKL
jgi:hypothetical protein